MDRFAALPQYFHAANEDGWPIVLYMNTGWLILFIVMMRKTMPRLNLTLPYYLACMKLSYRYDR